MRSQLIIGGGLVADIIVSKIEVVTPDILHKFCLMGQLLLSWLLVDGLLDIVHSSLVKRDKLVWHLLLVLDLEVRSIINCCTVFGFLIFLSRSLLLPDLAISKHLPLGIDGLSLLDEVSVTSHVEMGLANLHTVFFGTGAGIVRSRQVMHVRALGQALIVGHIRTIRELVGSGLGNSLLLSHLTGFSWLEVINDGLVVAVVVRANVLGVRIAK